MDKIKGIVNHPLSKAMAAGLIGAALLLESHPLYAGVGFGYAVREMFLAFKKEEKCLKCEK